MCLVLSQVIVVLLVQLVVLVLILVWEEVVKQEGIRKKHAEIKNVTAPTGTTPFSNGKKIIYENCGEDLPIRASGRMQIVRASELPPPLISSFEIIIV